MASQQLARLAAAAARAAKLGHCSATRCYYDGPTHWAMFRPSLLERWPGIGLDSWLLVLALRPDQQGPAGVWLQRRLSAVRCRQMLQWVARVARLSHIAQLVRLSVT
jgi:hypothetical protein